MLNKDFETYLIEELKKDITWGSQDLSDIYFTVFRVRSRRDGNFLDSFIAIREKEYKRICDDAYCFNRLVAAGVDNWEGYSEAIKDEDEDD